MHTMWKGSVSFGLVNVPVRMFAATESKDVKFRYLHEPCKTPIQYTRTCPHCEKNVGWDEIVRGYEYEPDHFVLMTDEDLQKPERSHTIDIVEFVELSEIDPIFFDKTYYLSPETAGSKAYSLLEEAMGQTGKIAVARTVLRNSETLACLRVNQGVLLMETLFWPDEVRPTAELPNLTQAAVTDQELNMAVTLISQLATSFSPEKYVDQHREEVLQRIHAKVHDEGTRFAAPAARQTENIVDLMTALQESIRSTKPGKSRKKTS